MYNSAKTGWYKVINSSKVSKPMDEHMKSYEYIDNVIYLKYRSSLELKAIRYADFNKHVLKWSVEPFPIKYVKPTDGKIHRYYIDLFLEFTNNIKFLVEIKSKSETIKPIVPKRKTEKSIWYYQKALQTYAVNQAKWKAATEFAKLNNMQFIILTENELK